jgi:hypothetical protein
MDTDDGGESRMVGALQNAFRPAINLNSNLMTRYRVTEVLRPKNGTKQHSGLTLMEGRGRDQLWAARGTFRRKD